MESMSEPTTTETATAPMRGIDRSAPAQEQLLSARRMIAASFHNVGEPVTVRGERFVVVAPRIAKALGHPDSITRLHYGVSGEPGSYRSDVSVAKVADGTVEVEVPWQF